MLATAAAKLAEGKALRGRLLVLSGGVVSALAVTTLKHNVIARHKSSFQNLYAVVLSSRTLSSGRCRFLFI
jgi:NH3-dependent NAD+ synthetase